MNQTWKQFLTLRLLGALVGLGVAAQLLAILLSNVPMWRDRGDELALAVTRDPTNYRILLFGDSISRNATVRFSLGGSGDVANLATNAYIGLPGSLLLLERYLSVHTTPQHVVLALAPSVYHYADETSLARYYLWHTFNRPDERRFLSAYFPGIERRDWYPAILDLQERIIEPAFSLVKGWSAKLRKRDVLSISDGSLIPSAEAAVELAVHRTASTGEEISAEDRDLSLAPVNLEALNRICSLARTFDFKIDIVWPPVPKTIVTLLEAEGAWAQLEGRIRAIMDGRCSLKGFYDFNKLRDYEDAGFHTDMLHLYGDGWEQRYASDLRSYLEGLARPEMTDASR